MGNPELQATVELSVEFQKFYNVDLFQRGYYQVRSHVKASPKVPVKVEVSLPRNQPSDMAFPACIVNGAAVTKTFQILYRNEEVRLDDVVNFRIHAIVEAGKVLETLKKLDIQLSLELWYTEHGIGLNNLGIASNFGQSTASDSCMQSPSLTSLPTNNGQMSTNSIECVSSRLLSINLIPTKGLHYHLPVLFDYFHLSAVSLTIHSALVALHQPYINTPRFNGNGSGKTKRTNSRNHKNAMLHQQQSNANKAQQSMDTLFFGNTSAKSKNEVDRLASAREIHKEVCGLLLSSLESLQQAHLEFSDLLHSVSSSSGLSLERIKAKIQISDCKKRLQQLSDIAKVKKSEDEFLETACSDISQLCGELVVLWNNFVNLFTGRPEISQHLARVHHHQRVKRFSEAFFLVDHPRKSALDCVESMYARYASLTERLRASEYLTSLPPLPVSCVELDGDASTMPIIYEDVYRDEEALKEDFRLRRHSISDVKPTDVSSSTEDVITALESLCSLPKSRSPRPTSVPFGKNFLSETTKDLMTTSLENPLSTLSSGYFSSATSDSFKMRPVCTHDDVQVVTNELEDEEPSVLTNKTCLIAKDGFSHLDWSASVPYNMAEEPDDVQGMKHSHSCQSMPYNQQQQTSGDRCDSRTKSSPTSSSSNHSGNLPSTPKGVIVNSYQAALTKQLELLRQQSRSTFLDRPRAKSEELMVVTPKFPHQMLDAQKKLRQRLRSDSCLQTPSEKEELKKTIRKAGANGLNSPGLVQSLSSTDKVKACPLPPKAFRDPEHLRKLRQAEASVIAAKSLQHPSSSLPVRLKAEDLSDPGNSVPMRRKAAPKDFSEHSTCSLSRIDSKRGSKAQDYFLVEATGDWMENKPLSGGGDGRHVREMSCDLYNGLTSSESLRLDRLNSLIGEETLNFVQAKEDFKKSKHISGVLYSDVIRKFHSVPYFHFAEDSRLMWQQNGGQHHLVHLVVCVHGLDGNSADLRLIKTYLEMALPGHNLDFLMSENNQGETFSDFESMTDRLVDEILLHIASYSKLPSRLSFVGHSLGTILIRSAISRPKLAHLVPFFHTFLSLSGPHLGTLYNNSGLVNMGMWFMQKWKKSGSLHQLAMKDATDIRKTFMYQLSQRSNLHMFRHVLLAGSTQDRYVPWHSARIELCKAATKDNSVTGSAYKEMVHNIISPIVSRGAAHCTLARFDIHHALPSSTNALIGRAAHIAVLDSELFIEKFLIISILKYFQ